ncbi:MAG: isopenicillin N synthase family dioxygenase, partial [Frankia sp.]
MTLLDVPLIDIGEFHTGNDVTRKHIADEVGRACRDIGFLVLTGHGVPMSQIDDAYGSTKKFFGLDLAEKMSVARPDPSHIRGYSGMGTEALAQLEDEPAPPDLKELFDVGPSDVPTDDPYYSAESAGETFAPNVWPAHASDVRPALTELFTTMGGLARSMSQIFAVALDLEPDFFLPKVDKHTSILRVNYYPSQPNAPLPNQLRGGAHTDYTAFTILWQEPVVGGGLQVRNKAGQWIDVPSVPGSFVVNAGDTLHRWTNGRFLSTPHRALPPTGTHRYAIPFFLAPHLDSRIE